MVVENVFGAQPENELYATDTGYSEYGFIYAVLCTNSLTPGTY
jgi:hypothetical protein